MARQPRTAATRLLAALNHKIGDSVDVGMKTLRLARVLTYEPDRAGNFYSLTPRVMINLADLDATGVVQPGSRVTYRLLVAGERPQVEAFAGAMSGQLGRGQQLESLEGGRPEMQRTLERAEKFLNLVALLAALLSAVAYLVFPAAMDPAFAPAGPFTRDTLLPLIRERMRSRHKLETFDWSFDLTQATVWGFIILNILGVLVVGIAATEF